VIRIFVLPDFLKLTTGYETPVIRFNYMIDGSISVPGGFSGGKYAQIREVLFVQMGLDSEPGTWNRVTLDITGDCNRAARQDLAFGQYRRGAPLHYFHKSRGRINRK